MAMKNHWIITRDLIDDVPGYSVGRKSHGCPEDTGALTLPFRLIDSDGEVYYEGRMVPFDQHDEDSTGFEPLDYFNPNTGCTTLAYKEPGMPWRDL
jgi:hypothetical protein